MPEVRRSLTELDANFCCANNIFSGEHNTAFLLLAAQRVLQNETLISRHFGHQIYQCAMGTDHQRMGPLRKGSTQLLGSVSDNGNSENKPLAASSVFPVSCRIELLLQHE